MSVDLFQGHKYIVLSFAHNHASSRLINGPTVFADLNIAGIKNSYDEIATASEVIDGFLHLRDYVLLDRYGIGSKQFLHHAIKGPIYNLRIVTNDFPKNEKDEAIRAIANVAYAGTVKSEQVTQYINSLQTNTVEIEAKRPMTNAEIWAEVKRASLASLMSDKPSLG